MNWQVMTAAPRREHATDFGVSHPPCSLMVAPYRQRGAGPSLVWCNLGCAGTRLTRELKSTIEAGLCLVVI